MKYYLIVGEASGDLHASNLMKALKQEDPQAEFRFFGGDLMTAVGGTRVRHYKDLAYMGFIPVLLHLRTIFRNMDFCKQDIVAWQPDVLILVDYPGFNLKIAEYVKRHTSVPVYYYISPKIWAWKEYRIKNIKRDVDELFSILPFEVDFFQKHQYPIHYIGNPCVDAVEAFRSENQESFTEFISCNHLKDKPIIALLAGSRKQEIKDNLIRMMEAAKRKGLRAAREVFADRAYEPDGSLVARTKPGAVIADENEAAFRIIRMIQEKKVRAVDGTDLDMEADSVCIHGDSIHALEFAKKLRASFSAAGIEAAPLKDVVL